MARATPPGTGRSTSQRRGPSLLLLPLAILVGAVVGFSTLDIHQDAVRPTYAHSAGAPASWHDHGVRSATHYLAVLVHRVHL